MPRSIRTFFFLVMMSGAIVAQADQLIVPGIPAQQVTFTDFQQDRLIYRTPNGSLNDRTIDRISHISVDGETAFNEAELARSKEEREKSIDGYTKAIRATSKPWLKQFAARRLLAAIGDLDRFDAKVAAYLAVLERDPEEAIKIKPELPPQGNKQLDTAISDVEAVLKQKVEPTHQVALLTFLSDLNRRKGDEAAANAALERLAPIAELLGDRPEILELLAGARVAQARMAINEKKYADAKKLIDDNRANITDPRLQSDALYILAVASRESAKKDDQKAMQDVALQFMRIVAHFNDVDGRPNVPESLLATADILEQIGQKENATKMYQQIIADFPKEPAAKKAEENLKRLQPAN